jgi:hypothetical protein
MRGRPAKKVRKANLEAKTDESDTALPPSSPSKEFTFDADHGGRGKTTSFDYQDLIRAHRLEMIRQIHQSYNSYIRLHRAYVSYSFGCQISSLLNIQFNVKLCILK